MNETLIVVIAGLIAGAMNAAAGGGSFVSVPALISIGVPSVSANMSSTIALYPGALTSAWAYRRQFQTILDIPVTSLVLSTLIGGFFGAMLLLYTPNSTFDRLIPWLLLVGAIAFALGPQIGARLQRYYRPNATVLLVAQFLLGIYGGYFGGAVGIMMMAVWSVLGLSDIKVMNAIKVVLVAAANTVAVGCFSAFGPVFWQQTVVMMIAGAVGGYLGALLALWMKTSHIRLAITIMNFLIVAAFFRAKWL